MLKEKVQGLLVKAMELIEKHNKKVLVGLLVVAVCGVGGCSGQSSISSNKNGTIKELETKVEELRKENEALIKEVGEAKKYLDLNDNEKELVDTKIKEINEATEKAIEEKKARKEATVGY